MALSLAKGQTLSLAKEDPSLTTVRLGLGWEMATATAAPYDLDASVFLLNSKDRVSQDRHFIFYNNRQDPAEAVLLSEDNRTGQGEGDDETVLVALPKLPAEVQKILFIVTIHEAESRQQHFGQVRNAYIRLLNHDTNVEIARFDLSQDASVETGMVFGELYLHGDAWKFRAVGQSQAGGLAGIARAYGVQV